MNYPAKAGSSVSSIPDRLKQGPSPQLSLMDYVLVNVTAPEDEGMRIGRVLVEEGLAACVNVVRGVKSIYRWKGNVEEDEEVLLIIKTTRSALDRLVRRVRELHTYEVPEIIAMPIIAGNEDYLRWIEESVDGRGESSNRSVVD